MHEYDDDEDEQQLPRNGTLDKNTTTTSTTSDNKKKKKKEEGEDDENDHADDGGVVVATKSSTSSSSSKKKEETKSQQHNGAAPMVVEESDAGDLQHQQQSQERGNVTTTAAANATSTANTGGSVKKEGSSSSTKAGAGAAVSSSSSSTAASASSSADAAASALPVMKGTFSYDLEQRRHLIRGMWNFENSTQFPPQRFELLRTLPPSADLTKIPQDGEFHGSFSLAYMHTTSKGKQKERSKVIPESGVQIKFIPDTTAGGGAFKVDGKGTNQFGIFHINGTATPSGVDGDPTLNVVLRKRYEAQPAPAPASATNNNAANAEAATTTTNNSLAAPKKLDSNSSAALPLPPPSKSYPSGVVCLRGKLFKEESDSLGVTEVVHHIHGFWAAGLDVFASDPDNLRKQQNRFEYEHKSSVPGVSAFPVSGRYSGWFDLSNDDGTNTRINERDVTLKFRKNSAGQYNVEGKGSNVFGKYSITGTLEDETITIFRHFQPRKLKNKVDNSGGAAVTATSGAAPVALAPPIAAAAGTVSGIIAAPSSSLGSAAPIAPPTQPPSRRPSAASLPVEPRFKLDDVEVPIEAEGNSDVKVEPTKNPANGTYSAVSRGILRLGDDGSHSCQGKWAVTREHFTNGQTSPFNFRLEAHLAALAPPMDRQFPIDSDMYKGSFQLKKQGSRYQTIIDQQLVMKFRMNSAGSYNVYGKGFNAIGEFNLIGTLVMSGKKGGQVELYRMYPPEKLAPAPGQAVGGKTPLAITAPAVPNSATVLKPDATAVRAASVTLPAPPAPSAMVRRESTRLVKLPSKLEDDDPSAVISRALSKCSQILRFMREKDVELGGFFSEPVDPVALGIPTYHQIIKEPMDLRTIHRRMEAESIDNPEEFARLCRLVFENAMTFNIDPAHSVHQAARSLLVLFNQKFRDVERLIQNVRKDIDDKGKKKGKEDKKRKRQGEETKSLKKRRLEEAQAMATANANAVAAIVAAAPLASSPHVTRSEFNMLMNMIQELQRQIVQTHTAVAELSPGDEAETDAMSIASVSAPASSSVAPVVAAPPAPAPERKKPTKRKSETSATTDTASLDDSRPLTLDEQELLTETINELPPEHLGGVIQIIREAAPVGADEDEIDLEIDQLDTKTQRKLLRHVSKFVKKSKAKKKPKQTQQPKKTEQAPPTKKSKSAPAAPAPAPAPTPSESEGNSFFRFSKKDDSDTDSEEEEEETTNTKTNTISASQPGGKSLAQTASTDFQLSSGLGDLHDDHDDNEEDVLDSGGLAAKWNMSKAEEKSENSDEEDDDAWGAAREHAAAAKAREAERRAREEKMKAEAEAAKEQRLADAAARGEELRAQRLEEEEKEARLREEKEKEAEEAIRKAREESRKKNIAIEQTVNLDETRDIMKQYEQSFMDKDLGSGASPSSDFGF